MRRTKKCGTGKQLPVSHRRSCKHINTKGLPKPLAGAALGFLLILIFLVAIANVGNLSLRLPNMENLDEIGGAVVGFIKGFIYCVLLCWLLSFLGLVIGKTTLAETTLARFFLAFDLLTKTLL